MSERKVCTVCGREGHRASHCPTRERDIERYLVEQVQARGGEVRKVQWIGRRGAPDRLVLLPVPPSEWGYPSGWSGASAWVEVKAPGGRLEPHQEREHARLRNYGQHVMVVDSFKRVDEVLS